MVVQIQKFSDVINIALAKRNMTNTQFAKEMNISNTYVGQLLKNKRRWHETAMLQACNILGISIEYKIS